MIMELYKIKTSDQSNLTQDRIATADGWFNHIRKVAPMCPPMWAHWRHRTTKVLYFTMSDPFPKIAPSHGHLTHYLSRDSLGQSKPTSQMAPRSVEPLFAQLTAECPYALQWGTSPLRT